MMPVREAAKLIFESLLWLCEEYIQRCTNTRFNHVCRTPRGRRRSFDLKHCDAQGGGLQHACVVCPIADGHDVLGSLLLYKCSLLHSLIARCQAMQAYPQGSSRLCSIFSCIGGE